MALLAGCLIAFGLLSLQAEEYPFLTLAGSSGSGVDGSGSAVRFYNPMGAAVDAAGNVYVADSQTHTIRKITSSGVVTTLAGLATEYGSADGLGGAARFSLPTGVAVDSSNNVYVADSGNHSIRKITPARVVTTIAGLAGVTGTADGVGRATRFNNPYALAVDSTSNLYVADSDNHTIRKITSAGVVSTPAGRVGFIGSADGSGTTARFNYPSGISVTSTGTVYIADEYNHTIRKLIGTAVTTLAGVVANSGNADGTGADARFYYPEGMAIDAAGNLYVADYGNSTIRKGTPPCLDAPTIDAVVGLKNGIRQLDTTPQTAVSRQWSIIRWPANSLTQLSSATLRNPTFPPDVADLYVMRLTATNASGQIAIRTLQFTAFDPVAPTIITQPAVQPIAAAGDTITLNVAVFGGLPLQNQWQRDGIDIAGATGLNLTLTNAPADQSGAYTVVVTNTYDVTTSSSTQLTIVAGSLTNFTVVGGRYTFTLHWLDGLAVTAEYSSNLVDWIPFATATVSGGTVQFTDPSTTTDPQHFYRVRRYVLSSTVFVGAPS